MQQISTSKLTVLNVNKTSKILNKIVAITRRTNGIGPKMHRIRVTNVCFQFTAFVYLMDEIVTNDICRGKNFCLKYHIVL